MYAPKKVQERLALAESEYHFAPEYHSVSEVAAFDSYLHERGKYILDEFGKPSELDLERLTEFDSRWILNEQILCMSDASYWLTRYAYVKDEENIIRRFDFRVPQLILFEIICDLEITNSAIEILILKARQLGMSTLVELLISHRIIFSYGVNAVIGSADQTKTGLMSNMLFLAYDMMPVWLKPRWTRRVESDRGMLVFGSLASGVSFQHGAQASGIARGTTPTIYHLSECASFTDPVNQIEASLFKAVHESPSVFGVLESSGEGDKGWWPDTWRHAKENWSKGRARLCPLFLPWFCGLGIWPTPTWEHMHPVPPDWHANRDTALHVAKSELFVRANPLLSKHLIAEQKSRGSFTPPHWHMPRVQQWFWEVEHEQAKSKNIESTFLQEMAGDDEEALQRSSESVFGHDTIVEIESNRKPGYEIFGLTGQSIEESHEPSTDIIDYASGRERILVRYASPRAETYRWELVPLNFGQPGHAALDESNPLDPTGMLIVWHHPRPGVSYSIGVDTSEGKGEDSTVISVWASGQRGQPDIQCAEFASPYVSHVEAFSFVLCVAAYYGQYMKEGTTRWREPYVSIEQVAAVGDTCQLQMRKMGYSNFHRMVRYDERRVRKATSRKQGWFTYGWSRPLLTGNFVHSAQNGWAEINSPWLIDEMKHFEVHVTSTGREKLQHEDGEHDDRIFAAAMAIFCPHDLDILAERSKKRSVESIALPPLDLGPYVRTVSDAERRDSSPLTLNDMIYSDASVVSGFRERPTP